MDPSSARWIGGAHVTSYPNGGLNSVAERSLGEKIRQGKSLPANMAKVGGRGGMSGVLAVLYRKSAIANDFGEMLV